MDLATRNQQLHPHARNIVYGLAFLLLLFSLFRAGFPGEIDTAHLANDLAFLSFLLVSFALSVTPLRVLFPSFLFHSSLGFGRRAMGVSAFGFALIHVLLQFLFLFRGSIDALLAFNMFNNYGIFPGSLAFFFLFLLFITSTDYAVAKLKRNWFTLHKLVYPAYFLIAMHAFLVGADFSRWNAYSASMAGIGTIVLALEIAAYFNEKQKKVQASVPNPPAS